MNPVEQDISRRKNEIISEVNGVFKLNMQITDWDVPEADDKEGAKILLDMIQEKVDAIRADVNAGRYDYY